MISADWFNLSTLAHRTNFPDLMYVTLYPPPKKKKKKTGKLAPTELLSHSSGWGSFGSDLAVTHERLVSACPNISVLM